MQLSPLTCWEISRVDRTPSTPAAIYVVPLPPSGKEANSKGHESHENRRLLWQEWESSWAVKASKRSCEWVIIIELSLKAAAAWVREKRADTHKQILFVCFQFIFVSQYLYSCLCICMCVSLGCFFFSSTVSKLCALCGGIRHTAWLYDCMQDYFTFLFKGWVMACIFISFVLWNTH